MLHIRYFWEKKTMNYILNYPLDLIIKFSNLELFFGNLENLGHFSWKILSIGQNHIFQVEILPFKKNWL